MEILDLSSATMLLTRHDIIQKLQELSNEVLCVQVAQGAVKQLKVKAGGLKKILPKWNQALFY